MIAPAVPPVPFNTESGDLVFFLRSAPVRKLRLLMDAHQRFNATRFHGRLPETLRLAKWEARLSVVTRHGRPTWDVWTLFRTDERCLGLLDVDHFGATHVRFVPPNSVTDFNQLPLGRPLH